MQEAKVNICKPRLIIKIELQKLTMLCIGYMHCRNIHILAIKISNLIINFLIVYYLQNTVFPKMMAKVLTPFH